MDFKEMLEEFLIGKIEEKVFYQNMKNIFEEFLETFEFRKLELLKLYPFISELQDEDLYNGHMLEEEISEIINILDGQKNFSYDLWMNLESHEMRRYHKIWKDYKKTNIISFEEHVSIEKELQAISIDTKSIDDMCMEKLLTLLNGMSNIDDFYTYSTLYVSKFDAVSAEDEIKKMLDILSGNRPVHILIKYVKGECMFIL